MTQDDIDTVSRLRARSFQHAYVGLVPQSHLDAISLERESGRLRDWFEAGTGVVDHLVAEEGDGDIVGWACVGPYRGEEETEPAGGHEPGGDGELYALHVRADRIGTGTGRALMDTGLELATGRGFGRILLWVLEGNARARRFYEKAGFVPDGHTQSTRVAGQDIPELQYVRPLL